jgi:protein-tyrosine phosphatase
MKLFAITPPHVGRLAIATRPRGGEWLVDDLRGLAHKGYHVLVSALDRTEMSELALGAEPSEAISARLVFVHFPVPDRGLPTIPEARSLATRLVRYLEEGRSVAVHCRMGIGRSSLICGTVLVSCGDGAEEAWSRLREARGLEVPDTDAQRAVEGVQA